MFTKITGIMIAMMALATPASADVTWYFHQTSLLIHGTSPPLFGFTPGIGASLTVSDETFLSGGLHYSLLPNSPQHLPTGLIESGNSDFLFLVNRTPSATPPTLFDIPFGTHLAMPGLPDTSFVVNFFGDEIDLTFDSQGDLSGSITESNSESVMRMGINNGAVNPDFNFGYVATNWTAFGCQNIQCTFGGYWQLATPVPEPHSLALLLVPLLLLLGITRRWTSS